MNKLASEKYNILLIVLIFTIPLIALDMSYWLISTINNDWEEKKQKKEAIQEAETLAVEGNFSYELAVHFRDFFKQIQNHAYLDNINNTILTNLLKQSENNIFASPFPSYNLYVFKIPNTTKQSELLYYDGNLSMGRKTLCKAFQHLYETNIDKANSNSEAFAKILLGKYTNINSIAKEMRGVTTNTNGIHKRCWFIWDYAYIEQKGVYGAFLLCDESENQANYGRSLALKRLKSRGKAIGAFIPVYEKYGETNILPPLDKSKLFKEWANSLTIKNPEMLDYWLKNLLPQNHKLGNYSAFCHLERNSSHIAIVLVKSIKKIYFPKWLIFINLIILFLLSLILYSGIFFNTWPQLNIKTRFILSYALASVVPLSLLCVITRGYLLEYEMNSEELARNELQLSLKAFDTNKLTNIREYKIAFNNAINDNTLIKLIEKYGIKDKRVTDHILKIFDNGDPNNNLPILGVGILDEIGEGVISYGSKTNNKEIKNLFNSLKSVQIEILRNLIKKENPGIKLRDYEKDEENDFANDAYFALTGGQLKDDMNNLFSCPFPRKNGDFCSYQIFDTIKINGKAKYMLLVMWDDKALDDRIISKAINNNAIENKNQNLIAYKIKGQKIDYVGQKTRHASQDLLDKTIELAKQSSYFKKTDNYVYKDNIIVVMPALNFNQIVFVGWVNKSDIIQDLLNRITTFIIIIIFSVLTLWICSLRSSSQFLKPISSLKKALDEVSLGNLNISFSNIPNNELGKLSNEFDKMIKELREKERLSKLISDQAVQAIKNSSNGLLNDTETFKGVALVSDIRNFTGMSEKYDPIIITELLNEHFAEMTKIILDNGGLIYKFIGDAIEAVFPEKSDLDESASERAFKAGCLMISRLKHINSRRNKIGLFTYRIGVGLSYGSMYSGTVGSAETRLDYSIIGDPLKNAAKYEALTINNPDFPLVIDDFIAKQITIKDLVLRKIDKNNQNINVFTIDKANNIFKFEHKLPSNKESLTIENEENKETISYFSLSNKSTILKFSKDFLFNTFLVICISLLITLGTNIIYSTTYNTHLAKSNKYTKRLLEQLKCDEILKSSFETLCLEFYDDLKRISFDDTTPNLNNKIKKIAEKYTKLGTPIPKYCCCFTDDKLGSKTENFAYDGFSNNVSILMNDYAKIYKKYLLKEIKGTEVIEYVKRFTESIANFYNMQEGEYYRRASYAIIENEKMLFDTERIFDKARNNLKAYIFCGMPEVTDKKILPNYYTLLAGKQMLLALKNGNGCVFSPNFPDKEKSLIQNNTNINNLLDKGYCIEKIEIRGEPFLVYTISKDLLKNHYSPFKLKIITFISAFILLTLIFILFEKNKILATNSINAILRRDIFLSAILPILTVCFVSYLYVVEESNVKKAELIDNLNKQMNDLESREFYYNPLCDYFLKNLHNSNIIQKYLKTIMNAKGEARNIECERLGYYFQEQLTKGKFVSNSLALGKINTFFDLKEIMFIGKDDWIASAFVNDKTVDKSSAFGNIISKIVKTTFYEKNDTHKDNSEKLKDELITEKTLDILSSGYGSDVAIRIINLPNNLIIVSNTFSSLGLYIGCFPNINNPDYIIVALIFMGNDFKPDICNKRNDSIITYKEHLASGSMDNKLFCFYSPNINVGDFFFYDGSYINKREELQTVKELGLVSSWINSSYLPLSKEVNICGTHYLEARQGNFIKDNVYAALGSNYPIKMNFKKKLYFLGIIIIISLIMILIISHIVISDLLFPVRQLIAGAIEASKGNYNFRTNFMRKDELGILCLSFDKMMRGLEEKQLMNSMVSKTALKMTANFSQIGSKKVNVVLLYISIPNFNKLMKNIQPNILFSRLREQIAIISKIVIENGGDIDKIMGEKLLIAFHVNNNSFEELASKVSKIAHFIATNDKLYFNVSVGVNCGQVISGYLGVGEKQDFTIIGDPVNVTARIESLAEKLETNRCLVSENIYRYIKSNVQTKLFGEVELKGKSEPMKVYQLL